MLVESFLIWRFSFGLLLIYPSILIMLSQLIHIL